MKKDKAHLIDTAVNKFKFDFHHAKDGYVMLTRWIPENQENHIPFYASHYIGVGGLVLNKNKSKILAIQEKKSHFKRLWKIPGGAVDPDESI